MSNPKTTNRTVYATAKNYVAAGLCPIPIRADGTKRAALPEWTTYQHRQPTEAELRTWFGDHGGTHPKVGIAVLGGAVSGNLEVLDIDKWKRVEPWWNLVKKQAPGLLKRLLLVRTPRPGLHVYYRCEEIDGNQKLAQIAVKDPDTGKTKPQTIIETRGEGGYVLAPGCPPACHPTKRSYKFIDDKNETMIPLITPDERAVLLDAARALNEWQDPHEKRHIERQVRQVGVPTGNRPGDDFNSRGDWHEILEPHGWKFLFVGKDGTEYWRRPGKASGGSSATVNHAETDLLYVFSSNAHPFEAERAYSKFSAYAMLNWDGDFSAAAMALAIEGYGQRQLRRWKKRRRAPSPFDRYAEYAPPPGWTK